MLISAWLDEYEEIQIDPDWPQDEYEEMIFSKWALGEILQLVWDHPWTQASETVLNFGLIMGEYALKAASYDQRRIFTIAMKTAWELLAIVEEVEK